VIRIDRRELVWINVTTNPTAEWIAHQITEAFPWDGAPGYMIRDRDRIYGAVAFATVYICIDVVFLIDWCTEFAHCDYKRRAWQLSN
jgi:hypothetical protein